MMVARSQVLRSADVVLCMGASQIIAVLCATTTTASRSGMRLGKSQLNDSNIFTEKYDKLFVSTLPVSVVAV